MRALLHNLALALAGYVLAVFVATAFCLLVLFGLDVGFSPTEFGSRMTKEFLWVFAIALFITATTAWPGFVATLAVARWRDWGTALYFSLSGVATAVLAVLIFAAYRNDFVLAKGLLFNTPIIYLGGLAGGFAYALLARRFRIFTRRPVSASERTGS
ncbi:MAG: hypothetical protein WAU86_18265 [Oricola sp.]